MTKLQYKDITKENFYDIINLSKTLPEAQASCVAPNVVSIAEGSVHSHAYYKGVYYNDTPIGFFMLAIPNEETKQSGKDNDFYLWRFMIAYNEQHKHYGTEVLNHIVSIGKERGHNELYTSCVKGEVSPYDFYIKYGFVDTGKEDEGEQILRYTF